MNRSAVGGIAAILLGGGFLIAVTSQIWAHQPSKHSWPLLIAAYSAAVFAIVAILTWIARPATVWTLPALFAAPTLIFSLFFLWQAEGLLLFGGIAVAAFVVGVGGSLAARTVAAARNLVP
jgi:hypothetical protein